MPARGSFCTIRNISMVRTFASVNEAWRELRNTRKSDRGGNSAEAHAKHGYDPNQPRVPAGSSDGGQWTATGQGTNIQLAAADEPFSRRLKLFYELARRGIKLHRLENWPPDLFGELRDRNVVTVTTIDGKNIFGSNSRSPTYKAIDFAAARRMRDILLEKYPDLMNSENIGQMPNNALFHAETTVLLRAARENGGSLAGRTLEVFADGKMCNNCELVLPKVGLELGNPTVTFIGPDGAARTMRDGMWVK